MVVGSEGTGWQSRPAVNHQNKHFMTTTVKAKPRQNKQFYSKQSTGDWVDEPVVGHRPHHL